MLTLSSMGNLIVQCNFQGKFNCFFSCVDAHRCARKGIYHESEVLI